MIRLDVERKTSAPPKTNELEVVYQPTQHTVVLVGRVVTSINVNSQTLPDKPGGFERASSAGAHIKPAV